MMVSQTLAMLLGIFSVALASSPGAETCSGETCAVSLEAADAQDASDAGLNLLQSAMRPHKAVATDKKNTRQKRAPLKEQVRRQWKKGPNKNSELLSELKAKVHEKKSAKQGKKEAKGDDPAPGVPGSTEWKLFHLAEFVAQTSGDEHLAAEAADIEAGLAGGGMAEVEDSEEESAEVVDLLDQGSTEVSPQEAAVDGIMMTNDDMTELHHGVPMEAVNKDTFQGDMMPGSEDQLALFQKIEGKHGTYSWAGTPWPGGVVKYCFSADLPANAIKAWDLSVAQFRKAVSCLTWENVGYESGTSTGKDGRCQERGAMFVQAHPTDGCWSYVGKIDHPNQPVQIASPGCDSVGTTMHEIGHALGMAHEQSRPDRDEYVTIDFDNTAEDAQFKIAENGDTARPYDILSLMHYGLGDFATNKDYPVISVKPKGYEKYTTDPAEYPKYEIGERIGLSQTDISQLADMYNNEVPGGCSAQNLNSETTCTDKLKNGAPFSDNYGDCDKYRRTSTPDDKCDKYAAGRYCCGCGGGWKVQSYGEVATPTVPIPAPTPPPPAPPPVEEPKSGSSDCVDSISWVDPEWGDSCATWASYGCGGVSFTDDLERNCPVACKMCSACTDSATYKDPMFGDGCAGWAGIACDGFPFSDELSEKCPLACRKC